MPVPALVLVAIVGLALAGLLVGYEPIGDDPDRMYRPIKSELAQSLGKGELPFWSDRFGFGVPLVAESHVAAFYPPNWLLYRVFDVSTAYRLSMWLHYLALSIATYAYARCLGLLPWGAALSALAFTLSGSLAIHSTHEPLYSALPFLPLALLLTERYLNSGRWSTLALLAMAWGAQLTIGHFQIQMWTAGLVLLTAAWRIIVDGARPRYAPSLIGALAIGAGIAAVQLVLSWDYAQFVGSFRRSIPDLTYFSYPPAHWAELVIPRLFQGLPGGPEDPYWTSQRTMGYEACLYVGTLPLLLAFVGLAAGRDRRLTPWLILAATGFGLATMPTWWPEGYAAVLQLPGLGLFRAPGRYTLLTSLGLALMAGRGFDRAIPSRPLFLGLIVAAVFATVATVWAIHLSQNALYTTAGGDWDLWRFLALAALAWLSSVAAVLLWRTRRVGFIAPLLVAAVELTALYYNATTDWGRAIVLPHDSLVLRRLAEASDVGLVAGTLDNLPIHAGHSPAGPYLGMRLPFPTLALEFAKTRQGIQYLQAESLMRRLGVTHGVWDGPVSSPGVEVLFEGSDPVLDRVVYKPPGAPERATWRLVRYSAAPPPVHAARRAIDVADHPALMRELAREDATTDTAVFLQGDRPPDVEPRAQLARVIRWDGFSGDIEHDGACDVVIRRTYAPGWRARINGGTEVPVTPVDGGLQSVRLSGSGPTHLSLQYSPPRWHLALTMSLASMAVAIATLIGGHRLRRRSGIRADA